MSVNKLADLKSRGGFPPCGFESRFGHLCSNCGVAPIRFHSRSGFEAARV